MYKKISALILAVMMVMTMGISVMAATEVTSLGVMDAAAVSEGTDANWSKASSISLYSDETYGTGLIATAGSDSVSTSDSAFSSATKRAWGNIYSKNTVSGEETPSYNLTFDLTSVEGMYSMSHGGCYIYLRSEAVTNNYLANKVAIVLRRNWEGKQQIALKPATASPMSSFISVTNENIDLGSATIKVVDNFVTDTVKVYATDSTGEYQLIGTVTLDIANSGATLVNAEGTSQSYTGYTTAILDNASKPMFLLNEYSGMVANAEITYPAEGPIGAPANVASGIYLDYPEISLLVNSEDNIVWYTVDGTDPVTSEDTRNLYMEGDIVDLNPEGVELPANFTLKTVEESADGEFSDVMTYTYSIYPENASYTLVPSEVAAGTSADYAYGNQFATYTVDTENDAFGVDNWKWTHVSSKFTVPVAAGSMEYNFDITGLGNDGATQYGVFLGFEAPNTTQMTSSTNPYIYFTRKGIGFRKNEAWSGNAGTTIAWPQGVNMTTGKHHYRVVTTFGGETLFYVDDVYAAKFEIATDGTLTVTNADGVTASRANAVRATEKAYANFSVNNSTAQVRVQDFTVSYPAAADTYPTATIDAETITAFVGGEDTVISVATDSEDTLVYYTLDGTLPTEDSDMYDGEAIVVPAADATGTVTVKVRPYNGYWGPVDSVAVTHKEPTVTYSYDFNDETYLDSWMQNIAVASTTIFAQTEEGKLTPDANWSMINTNFAISGGKTNTIAFDIQDLDSEAWKPLGVAIRNTSPGKWFNEVSATSHIYLMFSGNKLGLRNNSGASSEEAGYTFIEVDNDFTNETRVLLVDSVESDIIGVYVQDIAGTTDPELIAYITVDEQDVDGTVTPYVSLYSMMGGAIENVPFWADGYKTTEVIPVFMTTASAGQYTIDNVEVVIDNVNSAVVGTLGTPVLEEMDTNSDAFKAVKIVPVGAGEQQVYYTTDGTEPSADNGELYVEDTYIIITDNTTVQAVAYNEDGTICSDVAYKDYEVAQNEYYMAEFVPQDVYDGTSIYWRQGSNNNNARPSIIPDSDGETFSFDGRNSGEYTGGVGMIATNEVFNSENNPVTITEFDAKALGTGKNHVSFFFGMRRDTYGGTEVTNNNTFYVKLSGSQIGFKNEEWGSAYEGTYLDTNTTFNSNSSEYQHYVFIDDKVNNTVWLFVDGMYLGKYQFSTTELENDTVTLTSVTGETASRTYTASIPTSGQFFIGQAYISHASFKNLITYSGNTRPYISVVFDAGEYGEISGESVYETIKYHSVSEVPGVTMNIEGEFLGWTKNGESKVYTTEEVLGMVFTEDTLFEAQYQISTLEVYSVSAKTTGTGPVFMTDLVLEGSFDGDYDIYYTLDGSVPTAETGILWDGTVVEFAADTTVKAIAVGETSETPVCDIAIDVIETEKYMAVLENDYFANSYLGTKANDDYFKSADNRADEKYNKVVNLNEDGSLHIDGTNYQPSGSGVVAIAPNEDFASDADTVVYSFDIRNADTSEHVAFQAIYFGIRASNTHFGALVNNLNPMIALKGNKVGFKNNTWGQALDLVDTIPEYKGIASGDWVNIKIIDDRTTNIITLLGDNKVLATYTIDGKNFGVTSATGEKANKAYLNDIATGGTFYLGGAYSTADIDNVTEYTGITTPEYKVTFDLGEHGTSPDATEYTVTKFENVAGVPEPENITKHYSFDGWTKNGGTRVYSSVEVATYPVDGNITFTAQYSQILTDVNISVENATVEEGRTAVVELSVESEAVVNGNITIAYDELVLENIEDENTGYVVNNGDGTLTVIVEGNETVSLAFRFINGAAGDTAAVQIAEASFTGSDGEFLNLIKADGTLTLGVLKGDVDRDGKITVYDAVAVLKAVAGIETLEGNALEAARVTGGETVTIDDATTILKYLARIIASF